MKAFHSSCTRQVTTIYFVKIHFLHKKCMWSHSVCLSWVLDFSPSVFFIGFIPLTVVAEPQHFFSVTSDFLVFPSATKFKENFHTFFKGIGNSLTHNPNLVILIFPLFPGVCSFPLLSIFFPLYPLSPLPVIRWGVVHWTDSRFPGKRFCDLQEHGGSHYNENRN